MYDGASFMTGLVVVLFTMGTITAVMVMIYACIIMYHKIMGDSKWSLI